MVFRRKDRIPPRGRARPTRIAPQRLCRRRKARANLFARDNLHQSPASTDCSSVKLQRDQGGVNQATKAAEDNRFDLRPLAGGNFVASHTSTSFTSAINCFQSKSASANSILRP